MPLGRCIAASIRKIMDNEYKVGALCDLIASKEKKKKKNKNNEIKNKKVDHQLQSEISLIKSSENENIKTSKKRSSEKGSNELSLKKKKKMNKNTLLISQNEIIDKKPQKNENNSQIISKSESLVPPVLTKKTKQMVKSTDSDLKNTSNTFEKKVKKKKKSVDNTNKSNEKSTEKRNLMSKLPDVKSSAEYLEKESRTVFVGNVPVNIKMSAIKNVFKKFGEIETIRLRSVAVKNLDKPKRVSVIKGDFHPQRDTANVYVRFKAIEQAQSALALNATKFEGHTIRVDMALNTGHKQNKKKGIFIGNLPYSIQEDDIWDFFKDCGVISAVRIVRDNATGVSKGFGYVDFETKESVELAIQLQGKRTQNREIRIKRIEAKSNGNKVVNKKPIQFNQFKKTKPLGRNSQNFQGETMKPKLQKKKQKPTKTDLMRKKIAKQLN